MMDDVVEGEMHCAKCKFRLSRRTLYMNGIGHGTNETEPCPNGCGPLWPVTWRMLATELGERLEEYFTELVVLRERVSVGTSELVDIDPLKKKMNSPTFDNDDQMPLELEAYNKGWNNCLDELNTKYNLTKKVW